MKHLVFLLFCSFVLADDGEKSKPDLILVVNQASTGVLQIVDQVSKFVTNLEKEQLFSRYILIPFRSDEDIKQTDANADSIFKHFANLESDRTIGSECKDNSLTQIKRALDTGKPNSVILVFTDSSQEDADLEEIKSRVRANHIQIFTFALLTSNEICRAQPKVYTDLGHINNGLFLEITSKNMSEGLKLVEELIKPKRVELLAIDYGTNSSYEIPVDDSMRDFDVIASAPNARDKISMKITNSAGEILWNSPSRANEQTWRNTTKSPAKILKIVLNSNTPSYKLRVSVASNITIKLGFEDLNNNTVDEKIYSQPLKGINNTLILQMTGPSTKISSVEIVSLNGTKIESKPLKRAKNEYIAKDVFYCSFTPPKSQFRVKMNGTGVKNATIQLMIPGEFKSSDKTVNNSVVKGMSYIGPDALLKSASATHQSTPLFIASLSILAIIISAIYK